MCEACCEACVKRQEGQEMGGGVPCRGCRTTSAEPDDQHQQSHISVGFADLWPATGTSRMPTAVLSVRPFAQEDHAAAQSP